MKKLFKPFALIIALVMLTASLSLFVVAEDEKPTADVAYGTPTAIDGVLDDAWKNATVYENTFKKFCPLTSKEPNASDLLIHIVTSTMRVMWDENKVYFFFEVNDPTPGTPEAEKAAADNKRLWQSNSFAFYFDWELDTESKYEVPGDDLAIQYGIYGNTRFLVTGFQNAIFESKCNVTDTGYNFELSLDFASIAEDSGFTPAAGAQFGFGYIVHNSPDTFTWYRESLSGWGVGDLMESYGNQLGVLTLGEKPATPPAQPEEPETPADPETPSPDTADAAIAVAAVALLSAAVVIASKKRR